MKVKCSKQMFSQQVLPKAEAHSEKSVSTELQVPGKQKRLHYLDWLRVLAVLGVFYVHTINNFDALAWHTHDSKLLTLGLFGSEWGMSLFFLLAGASIWFSLSERTSREFIGERFLRLVIPFVAGVILLSPIQSYFLDVGNARYHGDFLTYYAYFFGHIQLSFDPQVLATYGLHLWFLAFLFLFSVIALPLFLALRGLSGQHIISRFAVVSQRRGGIFIGILPLALIQVTVRAAFPGYIGWTDFLLWCVYFVFGYLMLADTRLIQAIQKQGVIAFVVGVVSLALLIVVTYGSGILSLWEAAPSYSLQYELYQLLCSITAWSWMVFIIYFGMRFLNVGNKAIQYANKALLPFYVLHPLVIVLLVFFTLHWQIAMAIKFLVVSSLSLLGTLAVYEVLIKRVRLLRWLFGMKSS